MKISLLAVLFFVSNLLAIEHPVTISLAKQSSGEYSLRVQVPAGFGIQREAPNRILLSGEGNLKVLNADLNFRGKPSLEKMEYFKKVDDMKVTVSGKGKLNINAKIFYCDFTKNICIPGQIQKTAEIN